MVKPEGFVDKKHHNKVCKLNMYILIKTKISKLESSFRWRNRKDGFIINEDESCVHKKNSGSSMTFLVFYVGDIHIMGNHIPTLQGVKYCPAYILSIKINRDISKWLIGLSQSTYIDKVLKRFKMQKSKRGYVPLTHSTILGSSLSLRTRVELKKISKVSYASTNGAIMYGMHNTRPDMIVCCEHDQ